MPRKKIPFKILPGSHIRYIDDHGFILLVASDVARAMDYPEKMAGKTTSAWQVQIVQLMPGFKGWRMMTLDDVRRVCWRSRQPRAQEFRVWLENALHRLGAP